MVMVKDIEDEKIEEDLKEMARVREIMELERNKLSDNENLLRDFIN